MSMSNDNTQQEMKKSATQDRSTCYLMIQIGGYSLKIFQVIKINNDMKK